MTKKHTKISFFFKKYINKLYILLARLNIFFLDFFQFIKQLKLYFMTIAMFILK